MYVDLFIINNNILYKSIFITGEAHLKQYIHVHRLLTRSTNMDNNLEAKHFKKTSRNYKNLHKKKIFQVKNLFERAQYLQPEQGFLT